MGKTLIIAEKPSVALDITRALTPVMGKFDKQDDYYENEDCIVTSAVGHLVEIAAPEEFEVKRGKWSFAHLPVIPPHFDLSPIDKTKSRLAAVLKQIKRKDVDRLVNACDAGREGELIFRLIQQYAGGKKAIDKPVQRLWLQSMTPQAIRDGFERLRSDAEMLGLADAARSRSEADWLVGINGTRAMTAFNSRDGGFFLTTVGRVQTPTLSIVVQREEIIRKHQARPYWEVRAELQAPQGSYTAKWIDPAFKKGDDADARADRIWDEAKALAIAAATQGRSAQVRDESRPSTTAPPMLFDLTSLQREANGRFGWSAKTTLSLAQSLYEKHKALTYPRTDSRHLPEDYLSVAKDTLAHLAGSQQASQVAPWARQALDQGWVRPFKKVFDNSKVSDHFAIIPTMEIPKGLNDLEARLYDMVVRRFVAVFFPSAEFRITTRHSKVLTAAGQTETFMTQGKVLVEPGWMAVYGKEAITEEGQAASMPLVDGADRENPGDQGVRLTECQAHGLHTRPPARYNEGTLLSAMEGAGKLIEDDELRDAMAERGLGTPATRAAIIEGLINEKYMVREDRDLVPTAKAFQLLTLLRGLGVEELTRPELTGQWEFQLTEMERGRLSREQFMSDIADMTRRIVDKARSYDRDTVPGDYATLSTPCPQCGGVVRENYRRYACAGTAGRPEGCGFSFTKIPGGRSFELHEAEQFLRDRHIGPLEGFRSKAGWPFTAELRLKPQELPTGGEGWALEFDFGTPNKAEALIDAVDFSAQTALGPCPKCGAGVYAHGAQYLCEKAVGPAPGCDFKMGAMILQQAVDEQQAQKLLASGKTDLLDGFVSNRTRRKFKAHLVWSAAEGKVGFEFDASRPARPGRPARAPAKAAAKAPAKAASKAAAKTQAGAGAGADKPAAKKVAKKTVKKPAAKA